MQPGSDANITKDEVIRTPNTPTLDITTDFSGMIFYNEEFEINWSANDTDGDTLNYAVLFSADNGSAYTTLEIDYNQTALTLNSSKLLDCDLCRIKILATDGINTNSSVTDAFRIATDLDLFSLEELYSNNTERIFGFFIKNFN